MKYLQIRRPEWFQLSHIQRARELAWRSNELAPFFGPTGQLREIPIGVLAVKEPVYRVVVKYSDTTAVKALLDNRDATIAMSYPGGIIVAPVRNLLRRSDGVSWSLTPTKGRAQVVALISRRF